MINSQQNNTEIDVRLDSKMIELGRFFDEEGDLSRLRVLIEDMEDKPFWERMFSCVQSQYAGIDIYSLEAAALQGQPQYAEDGRLLSATGKDQLMQLLGQLGKNFMIAVDADYDWMIDDYHTYTSALRQNPYIQHTEYHSIENHLLDNAVLQQNDQWKVFCSAIEPVMHIVLSEILCDIFEKKAGRNYTKQVTINDVRSKFGALQYHLQSYAADLKNISDGIVNSVKVKANEIHEAQVKCSSVKASGVDIWKVVQGHTLYEYVEQYMAEDWVIKRKNQEKKMSQDVTLLGTQKSAKIKELKDILLGVFANEKAKFKSDVYACQYLQMHNPIIKTIQNKIIKVSNL